MVYFWLLYVNVKARVILGP